MPVYDYRCTTCGQIYEVTRTAKRASDPLVCVIDQSPCERVSAETEQRLANDPGAWYRSGHTHDDWSGAHVEAQAVGRWSDVLGQLQKQASPWMEQLRAAGFRGGDVLSAALSPAVALYTYYAIVADDEGRLIPMGGDPDATEPHVRGYLPYVWETLGRVALDRIFGASPEMAGSGISDTVEPDGRLAALFLLWQVPDRTDAEARPLDGAISLDLVSCFARPLGIIIEDWDGRVVHIEGDEVRLMPLAERAPLLLDADGSARTLLARSDATTLDRLHAAMLLHAAGRQGDVEAILRAEHQRGPDFRRLATALAGLYPRDSDEYRLITALLAALPA